MLPQIKTNITDKQSTGVKSSKGSTIYGTSRGFQAPPVAAGKYGKILNHKFKQVRTSVDN